MQHWERWYIMLIHDVHYVYYRKGYMLYHIDMIIDMYRYMRNKKTDARLNCWTFYWYEKRSWWRLKQHCIIRPNIGPSIGPSRFIMKCHPPGLASAWCLQYMKSNPSTSSAGSTPNMSPGKRSLEHASTGSITWHGWGLGSSRRMAMMSSNER